MGCALPRARESAILPRMKRTRRAALAAAVLFPLALVVPSSEARAGEDLDVAKVLARPGVRLVAVEFYATWCEPCMKAMPRWKALKEKYAKQGLRVVVVNTLDPNAGCRSIGWVPDESVCDLEGEVSERFQLKGQLPAAFLWSWQGNLLVKAGHIDEVERAIEKYLGEAPRVSLEVGEGVPAAVAAAVKEELLDGGKVQVLAGEDERRAIEAAKRKSQESRFDEKYACEVGKELPPNSLLKISKVAQGKSAYLNVGLYDLAGGCQEAQASTGWDGDARSMARAPARRVVRTVCFGRSTAASSLRSSLGARARRRPPAPDAARTMTRHVPRSAPQEKTPRPPGPRACYAHTPMASVARKVATYRDVLDAPEHIVAEVIDGELRSSPRPSLRHARATSRIGAELGAAFDFRRPACGAWLLLRGAELHLGPEPAILVPDLAGWRVDRATFDGEGAFIDVVPDWVCEVLSPSTAAFDRSRKADLYAELGVSYLWLVDVTTRQIEAFRLAEAKWLRLGAYGQIDARIEPFDAVPLEVPALFTFPNER